MTALSETDRQYRKAVVCAWLAVALFVRVLEAKPPVMDSPDRFVIEDWKRLALMEAYDKHLQKGLDLLEEGQAAKAAESFTKAIKLDPKEALTYGLRGTAFFMSNDWQEAKADFSKGIEVAPFDPECYLWRAKVWEKLGEKDKAAADKQRGRSLVKCAAELQRAGKLLEAGKADEVLAVCDEVIKLEPKHPLAYAVRAEMWYTRRELARTVADFRKAIRLGVKEPGPFNNLAWIYVSEPGFRNPKGALRLAKVAVRRIPLPAFLDTLACAYAENGQFKEAIGAEEKALEWSKDEAAKANCRKKIEGFKQRKTYLQMKQKE